MKPTGRTAVEENRQDVRDREVRDGQQHRGHAPLQPAPRAELAQHDVGRHVGVQEAAPVDADDPDQAKHGHSPLLVTGDKETRGPLSRSHQVSHRIQRWATQVEAAYPQRYRR